ncbi:amine oxidase [flavin-containing] B-like [Acropora muricata]|uniref:amine oxidase [flavin-containing] B-like n=1 Tax=Acropora muricata TaxID=159855 RepID=UPI0034E467AA
MERSVDVVVVGGGISGLCAAKLLVLDYGISVVVLEARNRVGGRTNTVQDPKFKYVDLGGAYVGPTQNRILRIAKELGIETYKVYNEGSVVELLGGKRRVFSGDFSTWNPIAMLDYYNMIRILDQMGEEIPLDQPWKAPKAKEWDSMTVKEFFDKTCWTNYAKKRMIQVYNDAMAAEPRQMSLLYYLWYLKSADGVLRIAAIENAGQERKFSGGSQQISNKITDKLGDMVILNSPVCRLQQDADHVVVMCENGKRYQAKFVISAMPQALLNSVSFEPPLPPLKNQLIQRIPMGSVIKTVTYYKTAFWREKGLNGVLISDSSPAYVTVDDTKPDGSYPAIMSFIIGDQALYWCTKTQEERKQATCEQYAKAFDSEEALHPTHYIDRNWPAEKYSGGCYVSVMPCGVLTSFGEALRAPIGRVYFAGTETATVWSGYMDGAVQAGERAAREVLHAMGKISEQEIHQTEPPSIDVPPVPCQLTTFQLWLPTVPVVIGTATAITALVGFASIRHYLK